MPELHQRRAPEKTIRIWCAACSSGQEPFSLVMLLDEMRAKWQSPGGNRRDRHSEGFLSKAKAGLFNQFEVQRGCRPSCCCNISRSRATTGRSSDDVVRRVNFQKFNLMDDPRGLGTSMPSSAATC